MIPLSLWEQRRMMTRRREGMSSDLKPLSAPRCQGQPQFSLAVRRQDWAEFPVSLPLCCLLGLLEPSGKFSGYSLGEGEDAKLLDT